MSDFTVKDLKKALVSAGLEVFRTRDDEIHLAERQNVQLMEAGVRVRAGDQPAVTVIVRSQHADAPQRSEADMFELVRARSASLCADGFQEIGAQAREIRNVSDASHLLDTWYEVTFVHEGQSLTELVSLVQRAMAAERYVAPAG